jgi:hypothetical protein
MNAPDLNQVTGEPVRGSEGAAHQLARESYDITAAQILCRKRRRRSKHSMSRQLKR